MCNQDNLLEDSCCAFWDSRSLLQRPAGDKDRRNLSQDRELQNQRYCQIKQRMYQLMLSKFCEATPQVDKCEVKQGARQQHKGLKKLQINHFQSKLPVLQERSHLSPGRQFGAHTEREAGRLCRLCNLEAWWREMVGCQWKSCEALDTLGTALISAPSLIGHLLKHLLEQRSCTWARHGYLPPHSAQLFIFSCLTVNCLDRLHQCLQ